MPRSTRGLVTGVMLTLVAAVPARADDFFQTLAYGLSALSAPSAPSASRFGQFAITYEPIPRGWRADWIRTFGPDAFGRPNSIDLGFADLTLNTGRMEIRAQQSTRMIDTYSLSITTPTPINYTFELNTGVQDVQLAGNFAMSQDGTINQFGFYDFQLNVSNRGESITDGFALVDQQTLDFDVGPINVSGNIFTDVLAAVTEPMFVGFGVQNPFAKFSGRATKEAELSESIEEIRAKVERGEVVTEADLQHIAEATFIASILRVSLPDLAFMEAAQIEQIVPEPTEDVVDVGQDPLAVSATPEPATLTLIIVPTTALILSRRRRRPA